MALLRDPFSPRLPVIGINGPISLSGDFNRASNPIMNVLGNLMMGLRNMFNNIAGNKSDMTPAMPAASPISNAPTAAQSSPTDLRAIGNDLQARINALPGGNQGVTVSYIEGKYNTPDMSGQFARASDPVAPAPQAPMGPAAPHTNMQDLAAKLQRDMAGTGVTVSFTPNRGPGGMG